MSSLPLRLELDRARVRAGPVSRIALDSTALRAAVGWRAEVPLRRSLADVLNYWRDEVHDKHHPRRAQLPGDDDIR
jgi:nucleoside-diphosphate-sugar epimerase